jgi:polar amino acid transport system substrate-binding protein
MTAAWLAAGPVLQAQPRAAPRRNERTDLRVGVAGSEPFVVKTATGTEGIAVELWQSLAAQAGWRYTTKRFQNVPQALDALKAGMLDVVVGPVSITAERLRTLRFSQPYFASGLAILSRTEAPTPWQRIKPFFNPSFFVAVGVLLSVLGVVGALIWLAERRAPHAPFPNEPVRGIANGIWLAIVTMSTVGYGDIAPRTLLGRVVTGIGIVILVITATSLIAGIASTLTLTGISTSVISTADQLSEHRVAVLADSPGETFARRYGARLRGVGSLQQGYTLLKQRAVDALVFDRPQLEFFLNQQHDSNVALSDAEYDHQNYGFALQLNSTLVHQMNLNLLQLEESGRMDRIVRAWLGEQQD